jgi:hypothetical protein
MCVGGVGMLAASPTLWEYSHIVGVLPHCGSAPTLREYSHNVGVLPQCGVSHGWGVSPFMGRARSGVRSEGGTEYTDTYTQYNSDATNNEHDDTKCTNA